MTRCEWFCATWFFAPLLMKSNASSAPCWKYMFQLWQGSTIAQLCHGMFSENSFVAASPWIWFGKCISRWWASSGVSIECCCLHVWWKSGVDCSVIAISCFCMLLCQGLARHPRVELARCTRARGCFLSPNCQNCCVAESLGPQIVKHIRIQNNMCYVVLDNSPNSACDWRFLLSL